MKKIALVCSRYNKEIVDGLIAGAKKALTEGGIPEKSIEIFFTPGSFEIPTFCHRLILQKQYDGLIALGCILKGETDHYEAVCQGVTYGLQKVSIEQNFPIMFGVLMCRKKAQAKARSSIGFPKKNKGYECGVALLSFLR